MQNGQVLPGFCGIIAGTAAPQKRIRMLKLATIQTNSKDRLIWMDLEMTGLDPEKESIIEIATIVTNNDLDVIAEGPNLIIHQPPKILKAMDEWNQNQHGKSGLIDKVKTSKITLKQAEKETMDFLSAHCAAKKSPLCGSSVHHDRRFLIRYMPKLSEFLHYRHIDVSTVKALVERWYPKNKATPKHKDAHRALSDLHESIEDLRFLRAAYFQ
jgi:oligoribonuclease